MRSVRLAAVRQRSRQIYCCRCFADAAFLIRNGDNGSHIFSASARARHFMAAAIRQPDSHIWVLSVENPLELANFTFAAH